MSPLKICYSWVQNSLPFIFFMLMPFCYSQDNELDDLYFKKAHFYGNIDLDSLEFYSYKLLESKELCMRMTGKLNLGNVAYKRGDFKKAENIVIDLLDEIQKESLRCLKKTKYSALGRLFWIYKNSNKLDLALDFLIQREKLLESFSKKDLDYYHRKASNMSNMSLIKLELGFFEESKLVSREALSILTDEAFQRERNNNYHSKILHASLYNILGDVFFQMTPIDTSNLDSANYYYKKAYDVATTFDPPHQNSEALYSLRKAKVLVKKENYNQALELVNQYTSAAKSLHISQDINYLKTVVFSKLENHDSVFHYGREFLNYPNETPSTEKNTIAVYNIMANSFHETQIQDSAYIYSQMAINKLHSLSTIKSKTNTHNYLYDFSKVDALNVTLQAEKRRQRISFLISSIAAFLVVILGILYIRKKQKQKLMSLTSSSKDKKEYNIDTDLELKIINQLESLNESTRFLDASFTISSLADELNTNTTYISNILNEKKGISFKKYILQLRIKHLIQLLKSDSKYRNYTIKALAQEVGYTNASSFTRAFKNYMGKTPSDYINSL